MDQLVQILGSLLVLTAFAAAQPVLATPERQWGFLVLEAVWALVSAWSLIEPFRGNASTFA